MLTYSTSLENYRQILLMEIEKWLQPPTDEERALAAEIQMLSFEPVERQPPELLRHLGMKFQECHNNCSKFVADEKSGRFRVLTGWQRSNGLYIHHSVVIGRPDELVCVTPCRSDEHFTFDFAADPAIALVPNDGHTRKGRRVPTGVRQSPEQTIAVMAEAKQQLIDGADPYAVLSAAADASRRLLLKDTDPMRASTA